MDTTHVFRTGVFAIIEAEGKILLARRRDIGWWNLPGGGMERGETVERALRREVVEEESGLPAFEAALATFLVGERGRVFLRAILDRALHATNGLPGKTPAIAHLRVLHDRLVMEQGGLAATEAEQTPTLQPLEVVIAASQTAATTKPSESGCPICAAASRVVFAFFAKWQDDLTIAEGELNDGGSGRAGARFACHAIRAGHRHSELLC